VCDDAQAEIKVGYNMNDSAEYFRVLKRSDGGSVSLSSYKGKSRVVLFFCECGSQGTI
jgi:thioredoxin-dependent peroxiredoxin